MATKKKAAKPAAKKTAKPAARSRGSKQPAPPTLADLAARVSALEAEVARLKDIVGPGGSEVT